MREEISVFLFIYFNAVAWHRSSADNQTQSKIIF